MTTATVCISILAALVLLLGMNVSRIRGDRQRHGGAQFPTDPSDLLFKAVRAHGNASEYVPTLAVLVLVVGTHHPAAWLVGATVAVTASRLLHAYAIYASPTLERQSPTRLVAAMGTYVFGLVLVVGALLTV